MGCDEAAAWRGHAFGKPDHTARRNECNIAVRARLYIHASMWLQQCVNYGVARRQACFGMKISQILHEVGLARSQDVGQHAGYKFGGNELFKTCVAAGFSSTLKCANPTGSSLAFWTVPVLSVLQMICNLMQLANHLRFFGGTSPRIKAFHQKINLHS